MPTSAPRRARIVAGTSHRALACLLGALFAVPAVSDAAQAAAEAAVGAPIFEPNRGQASPEVRFLTRASGHTVLLSSSELRFVRSGAAAIEQRHDGRPAPRTGLARDVRLTLLGANPHPRIRGEGRTSGRSHYLLGARPRGWVTDVPHYARVRYQGVYSGVDLLLYGGAGQLEYDFVVQPGTDPRRVALRASTPAPLRMSDRGELVLDDNLVLRRPIAYQVVAGRRRPVEADFEVRGRDSFGFRVGPFDRSRPLIIDPVLVYSTYLGGADVDEGAGVAVDPAGNAYVTGTDASFPGCNLSMPCGIGFVAKLAPDGALVYRTYFGGSRLQDFPAGIAVDATGSAYVVGTTASTDFPTTSGAYQPVCSASAGTAAFVLKLAPDGASAAYSTCLYGAFNKESGTAPFDRAFAVALDGAGRAWVAGETASTHFPTTADAFQPSFGGALDAFVAQLSADGSTLLFASYLGGRGLDTARGIALDLDGNVYVTGATGAPSSVDPNDFPTVNPFQATSGSVQNDAFVAKFDSARNVVYATYLGGSDSDTAMAIAADAGGKAYVTGQTKSTDFPTASPLQEPNGWTTTTGDAFVAKLGPTGDLLFSTHLGGYSWDWGTGIAVNDNGVAYVTGLTTSSDFPVTASAIQVLPAGNDDAFVAKVGTDPPALLYSTFLGGSTNDQGNAIALDRAGHVYLAGTATSSDLPIAHAYQPVKGGWFDAFAARLDLDAPVRTLSVSTTGAGLGVVSSTPHGIDCGGRCAWNFDTGTSIALTVRPFGDSVFMGWDGACHGTGECLVVLDGPAAVSARLERTGTFGVSVIPPQSGVVSSSPAEMTCDAQSCTGTFLVGTVVTLTPISAPGYRFGQWVGECPAGQVIIVAPPAPQPVCMAEFVSTARHAVTVARAGSGKGTVSSAPDGIQCGTTCSADFDMGTHVTLSAAAAPGSRFAGWSGGCLGTGACDLTVTASTPVTAIFEGPQTPESSGGGCAALGDPAAGLAPLLLLALLRSRRRGPTPIWWKPRM